MIKTARESRIPLYNSSKDRSLVLGSAWVYFVRSNWILSWHAAFLAMCEIERKMAMSSVSKPHLEARKWGKVVHSRQNCQVTHSVWKSPENWNSRRRRIIHQLFEDGIFGVIFAYCGMPGMLLKRPLYARSSLEKNALHSKSSNRKASFPLYFGRTNSIPFFWEGKNFTTSLFMTVSLIRTCFPKM